MAAKKKRSAKLKTTKMGGSVAGFLEAIPDEERRADCRAVAAMMRKATGAAPRMWGTTVVGFGDWHYVYESGREGEWFKTGFAPRKADLTLYFMSGLPQYQGLLRKLGKHSIGKGCLHIKRLADVDRKVLAELIERSVADLEDLRT